MDKSIRELERHIEMAPNGFIEEKLKRELKRLRCVSCLDKPKTPATQLPVKFLGAFKCSLDNLDYITPRPGHTAIVKWKDLSIRLVAISSKEQCNECCYWVPFDNEEYGLLKRIDKLPGNIKNVLISPLPLEIDYVNNEIDLQPVIDTRESLKCETCETQFQHYCVVSPTVCDICMGSYCETCFAYHYHCPICITVMQCGDLETCNRCSVMMCKSCNDTHLCRT